MLLCMKAGNELNFRGGHQQLHECGVHRSDSGFGAHSLQFGCLGVQLYGAHCLGSLVHNVYGWHVVCRFGFGAQVLSPLVRKVSAVHCTQCLCFSAHRLCSYGAYIGCAVPFIPGVHPLLLILMQPVKIMAAGSVNNCRRCASSPSNVHHCLGVDHLGVDHHLGDDQHLSVDHHLGVDHHIGVEHHLMLIALYGCAISPSENVCGRRSYLRTKDILGKYILGNKMLISKKYTNYSHDKVFFRRYNLFSRFPRCCY